MKRLIKIQLILCKKDFWFSFFKLCFVVKTVGGLKADQLTAVVSAQNMTVEEELTFS